jgi:hypothetical protein
MMRVGEIRAIDCDDYDSDEQFLRVAYRPDSETCLKNQSRGERHVDLVSRKQAVSPLPQGATGASRERVG